MRIIKADQWLMRAKEKEERVGRQAEVCFLSMETNRQTDKQSRKCKGSKRVQVANKDDEGSKCVQTKALEKWIGIKCWHTEQACASVGYGKVHTTHMYGICMHACMQASRQAGKYEKWTEGKTSAWTSRQWTKLDSNAHSRCKYEER